MLYQYGANTALLGMLKEAILMDATLIEATCSTTNKAGERDPMMQKNYRMAHRKGAGRRILNQT